MSFTLVCGVAAGLATDFDVGFFVSSSDESESELSDCFFCGATLSIGFGVTATFLAAGSSSESLSLSELSCLDFAVVYK